MHLQPSIIRICFRFLTSGGLATGVHWLVMLLLIHFGANAVASTAVGAIVGAIVNYVLQYYHTFLCQTAHTTVFQAYLRVVLIGWVSNVILFYSLYNFVLPSAAWAQLITTTLVTILNFSLYRKVVFHDRQ